MSWRHVARTEFGDVYLVSLTWPNGEREAATLLYEGHAEVSWRRGDWKIAVMPKGPNQSLQPTGPSARC